MTKSTLISITDYFSTHEVPAELVDAVDALKAERAKNEAKAQSNRDLYNDAHDAVMAVINDEPKTVTAIHDECVGLPEGFSKAKVQYALREYWASEVVKHDNGKGPFTYTKA